MLSPDADLWADALAVRLRGNRVCAVRTHRNFSGRSVAAQKRLLGSKEKTCGEAQDQVYTKRVVGTRSSPFLLAK
jgi:hypothetical protein